MNESLILSIRQGICPGSVPEITGRCCNSLLRRDRCRNHIKYSSRLQLSLCPEVEFCSPAKEYDSRSHWRKIRSAGKLSGNCFFGRRTRRKPWAAAGPILSVLPERSALLRRLPRPKPILISSKQPRREMARSSPKYTVLNNPVGKKLVKQISGTSKVPEKMQKKSRFLIENGFLVVAGERNIVYQQLFESVLIYHAAFVR